MLQCSKFYSLLAFSLCFLALANVQQEIINIVVITTGITMMAVELAGFLSPFPAKTRTTIQVLKDAYTQINFNWSDLVHTFFSKKCAYVSQICLLPINEILINKGKHGACKINFYWANMACHT